MSAYMLGGKVLKAFAKEGNGLAYWQAKLTSGLFKADEVPVFNFCRDHFAKFQKVPDVATLEEAFPSLKEIEVVEPPKYYLQELETRFEYETIDQLSQGSRSILKNDAKATKEAEKFVREKLNLLANQRYRTRILDVGGEAPELLLNTYHGSDDEALAPAYFGWQYLDKAGGLAVKEVASFVGRPATGKSWKMLYSAIHNWRGTETLAGENVLFVSMEMSDYSVAQRIASLYAGTNIKQLKVGGYSTKTFQLYAQGLVRMGKEPAKFYVVDANLDCTVPDIFALAEVLGCKIVFIDGAYLVKHQNAKLDRYTKVAENAELIKKYTAETFSKTFCSWQFAKTASQKFKKKGEKVGMEDIGYSDAIGQTSAIVIGIMQEEGVETILQRKLEILKGRDGQEGAWHIKWDFSKMDFTEVKPDDHLLMADKDELDPNSL